MAVRLFVGNLSYATTEADLRTYFGTVAAPSQVVLPVDRDTGRPRGFAFVEFQDRANAEAAIQKFNGQPFNGRPLAVSEARAREDRGPGGFSGPRPGGPPGRGLRPPLAGLARLSREARRLRSARATSDPMPSLNEAAARRARRRTRTNRAGPSPSSPRADPSRWTTTRRMNHYRAISTISPRASRPNLAKCPSQTTIRNSAGASRG